MLRSMNNNNDKNINENKSRDSKTNVHLFMRRINKSSIGCDYHDTVAAVTPVKYTAASAAASAAKGAWQT